MRRTPASPGGIASALSRVTRRYRWPLAVLWLVLVGVAGVSAVSIDSVLSGGGWYAPGSQSQRAAAELAAADLIGRGHTAIALVVHDSGHVAGEPAFEARVRQVVDAVTHDATLRVSSHHGWTTLSTDARDPFLGGDRRTVIEAIALDLDDGAARRELPGVEERLADRFTGQSLYISLVGVTSLDGAANTVSEQDLVKAEVLMFPLIAIILFLLYRSVVAVLASLAVSTTAIILALGVLAQIARHYELSNFAENSAATLGFGIGADYSLFMIARFREEMRKGRDVADAVTESLRASGHTVFFSGITVMLTMVALFLVHLRVIESIALGAIVVAGFCVLAATVALPVLLHLVGHRIYVGMRGPQGHPVSRPGGWHQVASAVMRHPVLVGGAAVAVLIALALPALQLRIFTPDARILPQSSSVRQGYDLVQQQFGIGVTSPIQVVVHTSTVPMSDLAALVTLNDQLKALPHVARVQSLVEVLSTASPQRPLDAVRPGGLDRLPPEVQQSVGYFVAADRRTAVIEVVPDVKASDDAALTLVVQVRDRAAAMTAANPSLEVVVGGETAEGMDSNEAIRRSLVPAMLVMLGLIFVILLITFRSVFLPLKAVALNFVSVGATYGILVLVFQKGYATSLLGLHQTGNLQNFVPVLLLAILFSLSTDYEVFLLNRVRENYLSTGDNTAAVASGMQATGPLISGAAILMVAVFGAFGFTGMVPIEQLGFGMAVGVAFDATLVRLILVPAAMRLMGRWNWWPTRHAEFGRLNTATPDSYPRIRSNSPGRSWTGGLLWRAVRPYRTNNGRRRLGDGRASYDAHAGLVVTQARELDELRLRLEQLAVENAELRARLRRNSYLR